jgi:hypothetical protein
MSLLVELEVTLRHRDRSRFLAHLKTGFSSDHNYLWAVGYAQMMFGDAPSFPPFRNDPTLSNNAQQRERLCSDHLHSLLYAQRSGFNIEWDKEPIVISPMFDAFGDRFEISSWGVAMVLNFVMMQQIRAKRRAAAVVCMRDDGLTLLEWIAHYRTLGFDHIFVFSNNNRDKSEVLLSALAGLKEITYLEQQTDLVVSPQMRAFEYSIHFMASLRDFEWVIYLDSDEFLILDNQDQHSVHALLDRVSKSENSKCADAILFQWRWYVSASRFAWEPDLLLRRFTHARTSEYSKTMVRLAAVTSMRQVHFAETKAPAISLNADLTPVTAGQPPLNDLRPAHAVLNHYWCKSFQEFIIKQQRGMSVTGETRRSFHRDETLFFLWNGPETQYNKVEPPTDLLFLVEAELKRLRALPDLARLEQKCRERFFEIIGNSTKHGDLQDDYEYVKLKAVSLGGPA